MESTHTTQESGISSKYEVGLAPKEAVLTLWPQINEILHATEHEMLEKFSPEEILCYLFTEKWDIWLGMQDGRVDGFTVCQWEDYGRVKHYIIAAAAGTGLKHYFSIGMDKIERYALASGADRVVVMSGRLGWEKLLLRRGYGEKGLVMKLNVRQRWGN